MEIAELGEFGLIRHLTDDITAVNEGTVKGVGDDAAILQPAEGHRTLVTTDLLLEGIHFDLTYVALRHLGYKAAQVNFSDIYAMGGVPRQITLSLGISKRFTVEDLDQLYAGVLEACREHKVDLVGGDTSSSMTGLTISVTCIGEARSEDIVLRSGARDTDLICVSGDLGAAYMGLQLLEREKAVYMQQLKEWQQKQQTLNSLPSSARLSDSETPQSVRQQLSTLNSQLSTLNSPPAFQPDFAGREYILQRQLRPEARRDIVLALHEAGIHPTSMIDISDGLSSELHHICQQSACGCRVYEERIPLDYQTAVMAEELNMNVTTAAMNGGEDYELLFTVPLAMHDAVLQIPSVKVIGHITKPELGLVLVARDGSEFALKAQGWSPQKA